MLWFLVVTIYAFEFRFDLGDFSGLGLICWIGV